jgi:predicted RNA binding protein YcfA (HicA-like mRNA interferase family)
MDRALRKLGFARIRQRGSHVFYRHADGRTTTVPHHKRRDLAVPAGIGFVQFHSRSGSPISAVDDRDSRAGR